MKTSGIYIHIPFCIAKCIYCDFYSVAGQDEHIERFVAALTKEIENSLIMNWEFDTIFIGGGMPSLLSAKQLELIVTTLNRKFDLSNIIEFTLETNPGEAPESKLRDFRSLGVNRLSIGVQTFNPKLLQFLSRIHSPKDAINTFESARKVGFDNINCDIIYNIPNQTIDDWQSDLEHIIEMEPEHISAYSLTVEQNTKLYELVTADKIIMPEDAIHIEFNEVALDMLQINGYDKYEISNYSKPNFECKHNLHYWEHDTYVGFGPSAHSFDGIQRWNNYSDLIRYLSSSTNNHIEKSETLSAADKVNEIVGFGLRMAKGVDLSKIPNNLLDDLNQQIASAQNNFPDMIIKEENRIKLNQKGMHFADAIAVEMLIN